MTALVALFTREFVHIAMDTLVTSADDRLPMNFQQKFVVTCSEQAVSAGTGFVGIINPWLNLLIELSEEPDFDLLSEMASEELRSIASEAPEITGTTTIYLFGFSSSMGAYRAFAYRSTHEFRREELQEGFIIKPQFDGMQAIDQEDEDLLLNTVFRCQEDDEAKPQLDRTGIGGDVLFIEMANRRAIVTHPCSFISRARELQIIQARNSH